MDWTLWRDTIGRLAPEPVVCPNSNRKAVRPPDPPVPLDPLAFAEQQNFHPDPIQADILRSTSKEIALLMGRQCGKSTVVACRAIHLALSRPKSKILIAGPAARQSEELLNCTHQFLEGYTYKANKQSIRFPNGSRIVAVPGSKPNNVRCFSAVDLVIIDEAAFAEDDLYYVLRAMCAVTNGTVMLLSTPGGRFGFFYEAWNNATFDRYFQPTTHCARVPADFLDRERRTIPETRFRREYLCEFLDPKGSMFPSDLLESIPTHDMDALELL